MKYFNQLFLTTVLSFSLFYQPGVLADTKPCTGQACPLPANFDWIIACCSNSKQDRAKFVALYQEKEAARQKLLYSAQMLRDNKLISPSTAQQIRDYAAWDKSVTTTRQIKDWPEDEFNEREDKALAAIAHDKNYGGWYKAMCHFSDKYCW